MKLSVDLGAGEVRVICGPTAAGKSALALLLAQHFGGNIVSADSRQVYRRFDIGTAKPTAEETQAVPHHCIDIVEPSARYSAAQWADAAANAIAAAHRAGRTPVLVGGTGFYLRALFNPLFVEPELEGERRMALQRELGSLSTEELRRWCDRIDPARASLGRVQILRALELALLTGSRISDLHRRTQSPPTYYARYLVVDSGQALVQSIRDRVSAMFFAGWEAEVAGLIDQVPADAPAWKATGYAAVRSLVQGAQKREVVIDQINASTRQYAKRQRTWIRHQLAGADVTRVDPAESGLMDKAVAWWQGKLNT